MVCDIVKLQGEHPYKYRDGAAWIARRTKDPASVDERRLAAALREVFQRCFPPAQDKYERRPSRRGDCNSNATAACTAHEALAERLPQPAVRTACDTFGRYQVAKADEKWLRLNSTTF
jgi:cation transport regulator ChaB